jgi:hypothetical protein
MLLCGWQYEGLNASLLQYVQPPTAFNPSRFGHVNPASMVTFCTRVPNVRLKYSEYELYRRLCPQGYKDSVILQKSAIFKNKRLHRVMQPFGFGFDV